MEQGDDRGGKRVRKRHMMSCTRSWTLRKEKRTCSDWSYIGTELGRTCCRLNAEGNVLTSEESVLRRWKEYFEELKHEEILGKVC